MAHPPVDMRQLATAAGVSLATVSRALSGKGRCSPATRARIQALAEELGYRPDPGRSALVRARWHGRDHQAGAVIAHLVEADPPLPTGAEADLACLRGAARPRGLSIHPMTIESADSPAALVAKLEAIGCQGIVCPLLHAPAVDLTPLWQRFPAVAMGLASHRPPIPVVSADDWRRARSAWQHVSTSGYRRIGLALADYPAADSVALRHGALLEGWHRLPARRRLPPCYHAPGDISPLLPWIERHRPDCLLCFGGQTVRSLLAAGLRIPDDLPCACLVSLDDDERRCLAASWYDRPAVAAAALDLITTQLRAGSCGADHAALLQLIDMPYQGGPSLPPAGSPGDSQVVLNRNRRLRRLHR